MGRDVAFSGSSGRNHEGKLAPQRRRQVSASTTTWWVKVNECTTSYAPPSLLWSRRGSTRPVSPGIAGKVTNSSADWAKGLRTHSAEPELRIGRGVRAKMYIKFFLHIHAQLDPSSPNHIRSTLSPSYKVTYAARKDAGLGAHVELRRAQPRAPWRVVGASV